MESPNRRVGSSSTASVRARFESPLLRQFPAFFESCGRTGLIKDAHELLIASANSVHGIFAGDVRVSQLYEGIPEHCAADGKANESRDTRRCFQPLANFLVVLAAAQNDAANFVPPAAPCGGNDFLAILGQVKPFDLPDVRFNANVLQLLDSSN